LPVEALEVLLALLAGVSLGTLLSTIAYHRRVSTLEARLGRLEAELQGLKDVAAERGSRLGLLESRLQEIEARLARVGETLSTIQDIVLQPGSEPPTPSPRRDPSLEDEEEDEDLINLKILALRRQGYSIRQIARELGIPKSTVHKRLKRLQERGLRIH
jgi:uncharacterized membrane protein